MDTDYSPTSSASGHRHAPPLFTSKSVDAGGPIDGPDVGQHSSFGSASVDRAVGNVTVDGLANCGSTDSQPPAVARTEQEISGGVAAASIELGDPDRAVPRTLQAQNTSVRRGRPRKRPNGGIGVAEVMAIVQSQNRRCALSGRTLTPQIASLDHKRPVARGGEHRIENLQVLDKSVNRAKGVLTNDEFIALCAEVTRHCGAETKLETRKETP